MADILKLPCYISPGWYITQILTLNSVDQRTLMTDRLVKVRKVFESFELIYKNFFASPFKMYEVVFTLEKLESDCKRPVWALSVSRGKPYWIAVKDKLFAAGS